MLETSFSVRAGCGALGVVARFFCRQVSERPAGGLAVCGAAVPLGARGVPAEAPGHRRRYLAAAPDETPNPVNFLDQGGIGGPPEPANLAHDRALLDQQHPIRPGR